MRKDVKVGIAILVISAIIAFMSPVLGIVVFAVCGPVTCVGLWMVANGIRKSRADKKSKRKGHNCFAKVLKIEPYSTETRVSNAVKTVKRVLVCIYDDMGDRFINVADIMDDKEIGFAVGDYIRVSYYENDFNYVSNLHSIEDVPDPAREKFIKLLKRCSISGVDSAGEKISEKVDTSGWTLTEEAYSDGIPIEARTEQIELPDDGIVIEELINSVETVSAIEDYDIDKYARLLGTITVIVVILFFLSIIISGILLGIYFS